MTVKVKHGLVRFKPLSVNAKKISNLHFKRDASKDIWTYSFRVKSLKQLEKQLPGSLHLSVPIANIHDQTFKVWFAFGVKESAKNSAVQAAMNGNNDEEATTPSDSASVPSASASPKATSNDSNANTGKTSKVANDNNGAITTADLAKYRVTPKKHTSADIALINYPFLPVILIFTGIASLIIIGAASLRKRILKGRKK